MLTFRLAKSAKLLTTRVGRVSPLLKNTVARSFSDFKEYPGQYGPGGKPGQVADDADQATGMERLELEAFARGEEFFLTQAIQMKKGQGTFENPIMVPSELHERHVAMVPKGMDQPIYFVISDDGIFYVPELDLHFKLFNPFQTAAEAHAHSH